MSKKKLPEDLKKCGRKRIIESPEEFDRLVDNYIKMCRTANEPILYVGMALALGFVDKVSFFDYGTYPEFSNSVKRAKSFVEIEYEKRLVNGTNAAAPIFALKNFGWSDKQEIDHTSSDGSMTPKKSLSQFYGRK